MVRKSNLNNSSLSFQAEVHVKKSIWNDLRQIFKIRDIYAVLVLGFSFGFYLSGKSIHGTHNQ